MCTGNCKATGLLKCQLDEGILNRLISRILVGEVKKIDGEKFQEIKIIYNFVGEIPAVTE